MVIYNLVHLFLHKIVKGHFRISRLTWLILATYTPICLFAQYQDGNTRAWGDIDNHGHPWVQCDSRPYHITKGLNGRHLSIWASHGRYFDQNKGTWKWQRPLLFGTTEDLFTPTIVLPYLIPMLENAGANVFTPRERDEQRHEVIVDNDDAIHAPYYFEWNRSKSWKTCDSVGFARPQGVLTERDNPFRIGTLRQAKATKKNKYSEISYQPNIPEEGKYAVYVSYKTLPKSVPDAKYVVYHKGQTTTFTVNQRMGGGTWVYLGTFDFDQGCNIFNRVVCTNQASKKGIVTSDAVRFGGGMGNIARGGMTSGLPRSLEGARYYAQWAGAPYSVYSSKKGTNDYADDINVRSLMTNWLAGGSCYAPAHEGLKVPIELALAIHSDAGYSTNGRDLIGNLAICTTNFNDGLLESGISRQTSKDFASALLNNATKDIEAKYHHWAQRYLWDRNYSETRLPAMPSAILETLSHQNFPDMKLAQDPMFRFTLARSIYKTILRYVNSNHGLPYIIQPLPPTNFSVSLTHDGKAILNWQPVLDPQEPTATPKAYNVYVASGSGGFDNGTCVKSNHFEMPIQQGKLYTFKVTACNDGGESFPTELLSAQWESKTSPTILVINGFHRLAAPQVIDNDSLQGFDMSQDMGVPYGTTLGWAGKQRNFDRKNIGIEGSSGLGYCGEEMVGQPIVGNRFDGVAEHAQAIAACHRYNIASTSSYALLNGHIKMQGYSAVDLILGLERYDGYTPEYYKTLTEQMQFLLRSYLSTSGKLLISGSYLGSDMSSVKEIDFLQRILHVSYVPTDTLQLTSNLHGLGLQCDYYNRPNRYHFAATHPEILQPMDNAICAMQYGNGSSAAVAWKQNGQATFVMGLPIECITSKVQQKQLINGILKYLLDK